jgi:hypothetical protein
MRAPPVLTPHIQAVYDSYPKEMRKALLNIRRLIFDVAASTSNVGTIQEVLRWNEPTYIPVNPKSGTPIRLAWHAARPKEFGVYVHCQTTIIKDFKREHPEAFTYHKTRGLIFFAGDAVPVQPLREFIRQALTYYSLQKKFRKNR